MKHKININSKRMYANARSVIKSTIHNAMLSHEEAVKQSISISGDTGPASKDAGAYWHPKLKRYVVGSNPEDAPHKQAGELLAGIRLSDIDQDTIVGSLIDSTAPHAYWVEMGTVKMAARPYLRRGFMSVTKKAIVSLKKRVLINRQRSV